MAGYGRVITALVTPFDQQGRVDLRRAGELASRLADAGSDGIMVAGTTGESPTLSPEEKLELLEAVRVCVATNPSARFASRSEIVPTISMT